MSGDKETPTLSAARILALITAVPAAVLGAALAALFPLVPAADRVPYFTSASAASLATFTALGRSVVGAANLAALWALIDREPGTVPELATYAENTATNCTVTTANATNGRGILHMTVAATATARLSTLAVAGTSIAALFYSFATQAADATPGFAGSVIVLTASNGVKATFGIFSSASAGVGMSLRAQRWTNKDNIVGALNATHVVQVRGHAWLRISQAAPGANILFEFSTTGDAGSWTTWYSATPTTVFGSAVDAVTKEWGSWTASTSAVSNTLLKKVA